MSGSIPLWRPMLLHNLPQAVQDSISFDLADVLWASVHQPTTDQLIELGTFANSITYLKDLAPDLASKLSSISKDEDLLALSEELYEIAYNGDFILVQPGGSPAFHHRFGRYSMEREIEYGLGELPVMFAYTARVSEDRPMPDGSVTKVSVFKHLGWS